MTTEDLLDLIATCVSHQPQPAPGGFLVCHMPLVGEFAHFGRVYDPVSGERARAWAGKAHLQRNPYLSFVTDVANGLHIANISLYGVIEMVDRSLGADVGQPISLDYGNVVERPANLEDTDMVIGGMVGWSARGAYVMDCQGSIRLVHHADGADVADEWYNLEAMLTVELTRIAALHDADGRERTSYTDLMHPNGRRWETEVETGITRA